MCDVNLIFVLGSFLFSANYFSYSSMKRLSSVTFLMKFTNRYRASMPAIRVHRTAFHCGVVSSHFISSIILIIWGQNQQVHSYYILRLLITMCKFEQVNCSVSGFAIVTKIKFHSSSVNILLLFLSLI